MSDINSEFKRFEEGIKRIWNKITGGSGDVEIKRYEEAGQNQLIKRLKEMEEAYREATKLPEPDYGSVPESLGLSKKVFVPKTDEELREQAETALKAGYAAKINDANEKADKTTATLEKNLNAATERFAKNADAAEKNYETAERNFKNSVIDRGLSDSSIRTEGESELKRKLTDTMSALRAEHQSAAERIMREIESAETTRKNAVSEYKLSYAADVEKKISSLRESLEKELTAVNNYNAEIAKKEAAYQIERQKKQDDMYADYVKRQQAQDDYVLEHESEYGYSGEKAAEMQSRYDEAAAFYEELPNDVAQELMTRNEETLKSLLGQYYSKLKNKIFR